MLITRRKQGEALLIGDAIEVVVLDVSQGRVKLGVSAPPEITVERKEWRLVQEQNRNASGSATSAFVQGILESGARGESEANFLLQPRSAMPKLPLLTGSPDSFGG